MASLVLCDGAWTTVASGIPNTDAALCQGTYQFADESTFGAGYTAMSADDFNELWPLLLLLFVVAFGVRAVRRTFIPY